MVVAICYAVFMFLTITLLLILLEDRRRVKKGKKSIIFRNEDEK